MNRRPYRGILACKLDQGRDECNVGVREGFKEGSLGSGIGLTTLRETGEKG